MAFLISRKLRLKIHSLSFWMLVLPVWGQYGRIGTPIHNLGDLKLSIIHFEMLNIVVALQAWGNYWRHRALQVNCDNLGVVQLVKTGKTKDPFQALCIRNIWLLTASYDIDLDISHIPGRYNIIADTLARIYSDKTEHNDVLAMLMANYIWERIPASHFNLETHL